MYDDIKSEHKKNMYHKLDKRQKRLMLIWLHSEWLTPYGHEFVQEIYERGIYNQDDEKEKLTKLRERWVKLHSNEREEIVERASLKERT